MPGSSASEGDEDSESSVNDRNAVTEQFSTLAFLPLFEGQKVMFYFSASRVVKSVEISMNVFSRFLDI